VFNARESYHIGFLSYLPVCRTNICKEKKQNLQTKTFYKNTIIWVVTPSIPHTVRRFGLSMLPAPASLFLDLFFDPEDGGDHLF
jgi:hypothetical protein